MIEGLKIRVTSQELGDHLNARADYHADKAAEIEKDLPAIREIRDRFRSGTNLNPDDLARMTKASNYAHTKGVEEMVGELEGEMRNRRNKAMAFRYIAAHLFQEDYTLQNEDLQRLEILNRWY